MKRKAALALAALTAFSAPAGAAPRLESEHAKPIRKSLSYDPGKIYRECMEQQLDGKDISTEKGKLGLMAAEAYCSGKADLEYK